MSASAEIPDIVSGITNTLGLNKLWQTDAQEDSEKWREQKQGQKDDEEKAQGGKQSDRDYQGSGPVSIANEKQDGNADHDAEVHGVPRPRTPTEPSEQKKGYEWPMPGTLKTNQTKRKYDTAPTQDDTNAYPAEASGIVQQEGEEPPASTGQPMTDGGLKPSKAPFLGSLRPFFSAQKVPRTDSSSSFTPATAPLHRDDPFLQQRPGSSSGVPQIERPWPQRRQHTMPVNGQSSDLPKKAAARSRWQYAAQNLRFPMRRRKTERQTEQTGGGPQVIATLAAGAPAATLVASHMLSDERSHHRVPVIVDLLNVTSYTD
jgi:hypothetical protein